MPKYLMNFPDDQMNELKRLSWETGMPMSQLIRSAVWDLLASQKPCALLVSGNAPVSGSVLVMKVG